MLACDPTDTFTDETNNGFVKRWNLQKQSKVIEMVGRIHADFCNVQTHPLPSVRMQVKLTKAKREFHLINKDANSKVVFKILDAQLLVKRVKPIPAYLIAHTKAVQTRAIAKYNLSRVDVNSFTFASGSQSLSMDNAVLGSLPKSLLFTLIKNKDFLGSMDTNPFQFHHYDISYFSLYVNSKQIPSGGLYLDTVREKILLWDIARSSKHQVFVIQTWDSR
jgi:hypothetical protein